MDNDRNNGIPRKKWTPAEDKLLKILVRKFGTGNWRIIGQHIKGREPKQCRERWLNHLDPEVKKGRLTEEEWEIVLAAHRTYGNRWSDIAKLLPGRTPNQIKNYWHSSQRAQMMGDDGEYLMPRDGPVPAIPTLQQLHLQSVHAKINSRKRGFDDLSSDSLNGNNDNNDNDAMDNERGEESLEDYDALVEPVLKKPRVHSPALPLQLESEEVLESPLLTPLQEEVPRTSPFPTPALVISVNPAARASLTASGGIAKPSSDKSSALDMLSMLASEFLMEEFQ